MENKKKMVRILHISDLHILMNSPSWNLYQGKFDTFFSQNPELRPNVIVITGDYHNISSEESFEQAKKYIIGLLNKFCLDANTSLFMVPGNHDMLPVDTSEDATDVEKLRITNLQKLLPTDLKPKESRAKEEVDQWLKKCESDPEDYLDRLCNVARGGKNNKNKIYIPCLVSAFDEYCEFAGNLITEYGNGSTPAEPHVRVWDSVDGRKLNIIHLNTALVADGSRCHYQAIDLKKTIDAFRDISNGAPTLVLAHNNFYDLHPSIQEELKQAMSMAHVCAWLCGDEHIFNSERIISCKTITGSGLYTIPIFVCAKGAPDHADKYSDNGFYIYETDFEIFNYHRYKWDEVGIAPTSEERSIQFPSPNTPTETRDQSLVIGYLSCTPAIPLVDKYHLGHAYFIHYIDKLKETKNVILLTSSYAFTHNRTQEKINSEISYAKDMVQRWEDCFERKISVVDIRERLQVDPPLTEEEKDLLYYIVSMEMKLDRTPEWMGFIENWGNTGKIDNVAFDAIKKVAGMDGKSSNYSENEIMSFFYLLYKRPAWYINTWFINFLHFWNNLLHDLITEKLGFDVDDDKITLIEASRNRYVWDAISFCAKRYSGIKYPKVKYINDLLGKRTRMPMKSSNKTDAFFLKDWDKAENCGKRFKTQLGKFFGEEGDPAAIAKQYFDRLDLGR